MVVTIDCAEIRSKQDFHRMFAEKLALPGFYGENLDALYDCLTDMPQPTIITLIHMERLIENLGSYGRAAINMMARAELDSPGRLLIHSV